MSKLQVFSNDIFGKVRVVERNQEPWFVGKDVAEVLGYKNTKKAIIDHVDGEDKTDGVTIRDPMGREQTPIFINESGLYSLILGSKLPTAREFKRWVTSEVLPSIRKTGKYAVPSPDRVQAIAEIAEAQDRLEKVERYMKTIGKLRDNNRKMMNLARKEYEDNCAEYSRCSDLLSQHRQHVASLIKRESLLAQRERG